MCPSCSEFRGEICRQKATADPAAAERAFQLSLQQAKAQTALSLELRSAISLARLWSSRGKSSDAADLLETSYRRFEEGFQTRDLMLARQLLAELGRRVAVPDASGPA